MSLRQSRKSVSMNGELYWRFKSRCLALGVSMSSVVESAVLAYLDTEISTTSEISPHVPYRTPIDGSPPAMIAEDGRTAREMLEQMRPTTTPSDMRKMAEKLPDPKIAKALQFLRETKHTGRVIKSPCRKNSCHIEALHERHD